MNILRALFYFIISGLISVLAPGCAREENLRPYGTLGSSVIKNGDNYLFFFCPTRIAPENKIIEVYLITNNLVPPDCKGGVKVIRISFAEGGGGRAAFVCDIGAN